MFSHNGAYVVYGEGHVRLTEICQSAGDNAERGRALSLQLLRCLPLTDIRGPQTSPCTTEFGYGIVVVEFIQLCGSEPWVAHGAKSAILDCLVRFVAGLLYTTSYRTYSQQIRNKSNKRNALYFVCIVHRSIRSFGLNFLVLSDNLIPVLLSLTCLFMLLPHLLTLSTHDSHHP